LVLAFVAKGAGFIIAGTDLRVWEASCGDVISEAPMSDGICDLAASGAARWPRPVGRCSWIATCWRWATLPSCSKGWTRSKAVYCVKHKHEPKPGRKMDGQEQTRYARKNWSSFMLFNLWSSKSNNAADSLRLVNRLPGRDLHRFCWLQDDEIGELDPAWNFLVGHSDPSIQPKNIHWTNGGPWFREYEDVPYAEEWRDARDKVMA
jgi:hypothetical protein